MKNYCRSGRSVALICSVILLSWAAVARAQQPPAPQAAPAPKPEILLKVDVVLSRFQGEKKTSSLPFSLWVNTPGGSQGYASVRVGVDVPTGTTQSSRTNPDNPSQPSSGSTTTNRSNTDYRNIGTSIDCRSTQLNDGRFTIDINVQDSSIFSDAPGGRGLARPAGPAAFRTFQMGNRLPMHDGDTLQFAMATDKVTGEILKVDVTISVLK